MRTCGLIGLTINSSVVKALHILHFCFLFLDFNFILASYSFGAFFLLPLFALDDFFLFVGCFSSDLHLHMREMAVKISSHNQYGNMVTSYLNGQNGKCHI
ncbi:hypothetical protein J1N35_002741 [Gossypium stocksii]|uniref:Uncharacterized protein n=1 Tax=Gossypium stocksii TaxID=47602 RepID=A0A9D3WMN3_9ROSI|nr:hypothetical protein J1N35_002741 [Gossypium stocksii]